MSSAQKGIPLKQFFIPLAALLMAVLIALFVIKIGSDQQPTDFAPFEMRVGAHLPEVQLKKFKGEKVKLSEMIFKLKLVTFWASWCEACMVEMPSIIALRNHYEGKGLEVIGVNVDENPEAVVPSLVKRLKIPFPIFEDVDGNAAQVFDIHAIPLTAMVDIHGNVLMIETGERDWNSGEMRQLIDQWLRK